MSLATWKREHFGPMSKAIKSDVAAVEHSIRKWSGLNEKTLGKHGLILYPGCWSLYIAEDKSNRSLAIASTSCAMCVLRKNNCDECVGVRANDDTCDGVGSPYATWRKSGDNKPMLRWLRKALALAKKEARKK